MTWLVPVSDLMWLDFWLDHMTCDWTWTYKKLLESSLMSQRLPSDVRKCSVCIWMSSAWQPCLTFVFCLCLFLNFVHWGRGKSSNLTAENKENKRQKRATLIKNDPVLGYCEETSNIYTFVVYFSFKEVWCNLVCTMLKYCIYITMTTVSLEML